MPPSPLANGARRSAGSARTPRTRWPLALAAAAALLTPPACSGDPGPDPAAAGTLAPTGIGSALDPGTGGGSEKVDACALLTAAEVRALEPTAPTEGRTIGFGTCEWQNPQTYQGVRIRIGVPNTASGGVLPPPVLPATIDGPDGIRFAGGYSIAEFAVDGRACQMDILNGKEDDAEQMIATVAKVRDRLDA